MKLIIQVPCYNEAETLAVALSKLPREIEGIDTVEWLIIDDGSIDQTAQVALQCGVDHIVTHTHNLGLARAFMNGINACIAAGADIIVNTDADDQYNADDIPKLVKPILESKADYVIGQRPISKTKHFSPVKKALQKLGSFVVRVLSETDVADAPSGFRAITADAAMQLNVFNEYTYTLETIIQAGHKGLKIVNVPIRTNEDLRPSKLVKSIPSYIKRSISTMLRAFAIYRPFRFFATIGTILMTGGIIIGIRFLCYYLAGNGSGKLQSLVLAAILSLAGIQSIALAFLGDLHATNRKLLEEILYESRKNNRKDQDTKQ